MPLQVQEDEDLRPIAVTLEGKTIKVDLINERVEEAEVRWERDNYSHLLPETHEQAALVIDRRLGRIR